ncbi:hypothetical protein GWK47_051366 [Chionoecetes opilio]|uniref:Uncharacterized protein n=1 Tax=Chionoecetes opilio TaxID=41210 RepID=A0A8J5CT87_CHIOP|nr:hypothetical protein GWK47_051366 [Chionoecetes opilio]
MAAVVSVKSVRDRDGRRPHSGTGPTALSQELGARCPEAPFLLKLDEKIVNPDRTNPNPIRHTHVKLPFYGILKENTELVDMCADVWRLPILEALYIKEINPKLNVQANDLQALPSMKRTKANNSLLTEKPSEDQTTNQRLPLKKTRSKSYLPINDIGNRLRGRQTGYK